MSTTRNLLLLSTSTIHGTEYLQYAADHINKFLKRFNVSKVLFLPYAQSKYDEYTDKVRNAFQNWVVNIGGAHTEISRLFIYQNDGYEVEGIHQAEDPVSAINTAQAIFVGGGNTFQLLKSLYDNNIIEPIREKVLKQGIPYIGSSAGTNVATVSICTTNDMPIVYPPSFAALDLIPFNINPHYMDPIPQSKHMGETREERIRQYHEIEEMPPVVGLREGSILLVDGDTLMLLGHYTAKIFYANEPPKEYTAADNLSFLICPCV